jgi:hypothetical protein
MKIKHETVTYYIEDAQVELNKILSACKKKSLTDEELLPLMEHAFQMLSASFNLRFKTRPQVDNLSQAEWEKNTLTPKEILG